MADLSSDDPPAAVEQARLRRYQSAWLAEYVPLIGAGAVERIAVKAESLGGIGIQYINATKHGGGVAEMLRSLVPMLSGLGLRAGWVSIAAPPSFYDITKKIHNFLQGAPGDLSEDEWQAYLDTVDENASIIDIREDVVVVHDPQPLSLIRHRLEQGRRWIWRCHLDLSAPNPDVWGRLRPLVDRYDDVVFSLREYEQAIKPRQHFIMPAIDPFTVKNRRLADEERQARLDQYGIPTDLPIVAQVSRFDPWKDPMGVIAAARLARQVTDFTLVLLGNMATDDPEGVRVCDEVTEAAQADDRIFVLPHGDDQVLVNALQSAAAVVVQKSTREGFGLTVTEAMWKGRPVVAGAVGGIRHQIDDGVDGFLVGSVEETAQRIVQILGDRELAHRLGDAAHRKVRDKFLLTRLLEDHLDLLAAG